MNKFHYDVSSEDFESLVLQASRQQPVLVDFWAERGASCKTLKPLLEKLADEYQGRFLLARVDADANPELAQWLRIRSIPTVMLFSQGRPLDGFAGALPEPEIRAFLDRFVSPPEIDPRKKAAELAAAGDKPGALALLKAALAERHDDESLRLDAASLALATQAAEEAESLLAFAFQAESERASVLKSQLELIRSAAANSEEVDGLKAKLAANPNDHAARLSLARVMAGQGAYEAALENALEVMRRDRYFNDDAARKLMLEFFSFLAAHPDQDDLVRRYRRLLSALIN